MQRLVDRLVEGDKTSDLMAMAMMLYSVPRIADQADTIVVMPGLGEDWRIYDAIKTWDTSTSAKHLFIAGIYKGEKVRVQPTVEYLQNAPFNMKRSDVENIHIQEHAHHTKEQADWIIEQLTQHAASSVALFVSPYHVLRAYCTVLKAFSRNNQQPIQMIPAPVVVPPATLIPELGEDAWVMVNGEIERIGKYQDLGDVATAKELREYIDWLWQQPLLKATFDL